jgi:hypothetical protein
MDREPEFHRQLSIVHSLVCRVFDALNPAMTPPHPHGWGYCLTAHPRLSEATRRYYRNNFFKNHLEGREGVLNRKLLLLLIALYCPLPGDCPARAIFKNA